MADLNNLGLRDDATMYGDPEQIPEQASGFSKLPPPRRYTFRTPDNLPSAWERFDYGDPPKEGITLRFDADHPLTISADPAGEHVGDSVRTSISDLVYLVNEKGRRVKKGESGIAVSDLLYYAKALGVALDKNAKNSTKVQALNATAGKEFSADWEWSAFCNPKRDIYGEDGKVIEGVKGCGKRHYSDSFKGKDGYNDRLICDGQVESSTQPGTKESCNASIRAFGNLTRFGPAQGK